MGYESGGRAPHAASSPLDTPIRVRDRDPPKEFRLAFGTRVVTPGIYLTGSEGLVPLSEAPYMNEALLQDLVARNPSLLATQPGEGPLLLVRREAAVYDDQDVNAHGTLDHLFLDAGGVPVLVEVKRSTDTRIRREVIGQMLDYATGASNWKAERLQAWFAQRCETDGLDSEEVLAAHSDEPDKFWQQVAEHLEAGRLRLYFVADVIPPTLRAIVEWLNEQLKACTVLAVEIKQYLDGHGQQTIVVPTVLGNTAKAEADKGDRKWRHWTLEQVHADLAKRRPAAEVEVAELIIAWAKERGLAAIFGHGISAGSVQYGVEDTDRRIFPFVLYSDGNIEIPFLRMAGYKPFKDEALRHAYRERLNNIGLSTAFPPTAVDKRPSFKLAELAALANPMAFCGALDWAIAQGDASPD